MACIVVFYSCYTSCICQHWNPMPRWAAPAPLPSPPPLHKGRRRAELYFCTHTLTLHGFSSWNLKTQRDGGKSCPLHCIALHWFIYILHVSTMILVYLLLVHGLHHLLPTMDDANLPTIVLVMAYCHTFCSFRTGQQSWPSTCPWLH
jgi:hypothetical protein